LTRYPVPLCDEGASREDERQTRLLLLTVQNRETGRTDHHPDHLHPSRPTSGRHVQVDLRRRPKLYIRRGGCISGLHAALLGCNEPLNQGEKT
jgi:hypothetical protein